MIRGELKEIADCMIERYVKNTINELVCFREITCKERIVSFYTYPLIFITTYAKRWRANRLGPKRKPYKSRVEPDCMKPNAAKAGILVIMILLAGCVNQNTLRDTDSQGMTPQLREEFDKKLQEWPRIRHLYSEGYFDSVITNDDQVVLLFRNPHSIGDTYFVWGRSRKPQTLEGFEGLFWVSYSDSLMNTDLKDARDIIVKEKAIVLVPCAPESPVISSVSVEGTPMELVKTNGDLWFSTWADDDNLYCSWGDGSGIGGTFTDMGVGCIRGTLPDITGETRYRDPYTEDDDLSQNNKPSSLLFIDGRLYMQVHSPLGDAEIGYLVYSDDYGITWKKADGESPWNKSANSNFRCLFFINMGKNYEMNTDSYVYAFGIGTEWAWDQGIFLARVPQDKILDYSAYEYLVDVTDKPHWSSSQEDARPIPGISTSDQCSAMYHPGVGRYLLLTARDLFDAPTPWGPWTYAGSWARPPPEGWIGGYQPGIMSKDTGEDYFWFTIAGQPWKRPQGQVKYCLNLGKIVMKLKHTYVC